MATEAHVSSIAALDDFRAALVIYLERTGRILDDVNGEVVATREWLQTDRQAHWQHVIRRREKELAQAEAELLTARLSGNPGAIQDRRLVAQRARNALEEAQAGLARVRRWLRHYETEVEARAKVVHQVRQMIGYDMTKAVAYLQNAATTLADYAALAAPATEPGGVESSGAAPAKAEGQS